MIKLRDLIRDILCEEMTFRQLMSVSDPARKNRSSRIPTKSLRVSTRNDQEAWKFSYKSPKNESHTGLRHQGFIYFMKEDINVGDNALDINCKVDCSCPDYRYRFSYANKSVGSGENGPNSLNKGFNYPSSINEGPGLCKHLLALKEYLRTKVEQEPPSPEEPITVPMKPVVVPKSPPPEKMPPEEPEEPEKEIPTDPTQTPEPEQKPTQQIEPVEDPTQTPQGPEEPNQTEEPVENPDEEPDKNKQKLKETDSNRPIQQILDDICNKNPIFILKYD